MLAPARHCGSVDAGEWEVGFASVGGQQLQGESERHRRATGVELMHQRFEEHTEGVDGNGYAAKESKRRRKHDHQL